MTRTVTSEPEGDVPEWAKEVVSHLPCLVREADAAEALGVSVRTLRRWGAGGKIQRRLRTAPSGSGRVLIPRTELARLIARMS
jgi:hypothetical protein